MCDASLKRAISTQRSSSWDIPMAGGRLIEPNFPSISFGWRSSSESAPESRNNFIIGFKA